MIEEGRAVEMNSRKIRFLDSDALKLTAIVTMLIDHIGAALLFPARMAGVNVSGSWIDMYSLFRSIGRTAFPIFVFLLVEGFYHTHSREKYFGRLLLFALLSEVPFDLAIYGNIVYMGSQNVFWTLAIGFLTIWGLEKLYRRYDINWKLMQKDRTETRTFGTMRGRENAAFRIMVCLTAAVMIMAGWFVATLLMTDYGGYGVLLIALFYFGKHAKISPLLTCIAGYLLFLWEPHCIVGFLLILLYNGTRKKRGKGFQYFFYLFYPLHLTILGLIRVAFFAG